MTEAHVLPGFESVIGQEGPTPVYGDEPPATLPSRQPFRGSEVVLITVGIAVVFTLIAKGRR